MNKILGVLILGSTLYFSASTANALRIEPSLVIASSPQLVTHGSVRFYFYDNGLIVPTNHYYDTRTLRQMARMSHARGWRHVYLLAPSHPYGLPTRYHRIAHREFSRYGISYDFYHPNQYRYHRYHRSYDYYDRYNRGYYYGHGHGHRKNKSGFYFTIRF